MSNSAEALDREVDQCLHLVRVAHIGLLERGRCADLSGELLPAFLIDIPDHHARPFGHEQFGGRSTDAACAAGHDGHLPFELLRVHTETLRSRSDCCRRELR